MSELHELSSIDDEAGVPAPADIGTADEDIVELNQYLRTLRERWRSAAIVALLVLGAVGAVTALQPVTYQSSSRIFVQARGGEGGGDLTSSTTYADQQIWSYADLATTPFVLEQVIADLGLRTTVPELADRIQVTVPSDTLMLEVSASSGDPQMAAAIANSVAETLQERVAELSPDGVGVDLLIVEPAISPSSPSSPDITRNMLLGVVLAALAGFGTATIRAVLNNKVRSAEDVEGGDRRTVLGKIPFSRGSEDAQRVLLDSPYSAAAEAYRDLRTNLQFVQFGANRRSVMVTSSLPGEGKSTVAVNLAHVMAMSGMRVLLIDSDLRAPSVHRILGLEGEAGLTTVLIGQAELADVTQSAGVDGLDVLTAGAIPPNPSELLGSAAMADLLDDVARRYEAVFIDAPPALPVTDAAVLSRSVGGVLVLAQTDRVRRTEFDRALAKLEAVDARIIGILMNCVRGMSESKYVYSSPEARKVLQQDAFADSSATGHHLHPSAVDHQEERGAPEVSDTDQGTERPGSYEAERRGALRRAVPRPASRRASETGATRELERLGGFHGSS